MAGQAMSLDPTEIKPGEPVVLQPGEIELRRALGPFHLIALGIGAIIGAGIFVITGHAAATYAGPGVVASFAIAGLGIGAIIGAGIFVITGHAAATYAGPGVVASFAIAGLGIGAIIGAGIFVITGH